MDTLFNEETASPPGKYCARPINRMGDSPRAVSNLRKGSRFPAKPLNQPRGYEPWTSSFRGGLCHCTWTPSTIDNFTLGPAAWPGERRGRAPGAVRTRRGAK